MVKYWKNYVLINCIFLYVIDSNTQVQLGQDRMPAKKSGCGNLKCEKYVFFVIKTQ